MSRPALASLFVFPLLLAACREPAGGVASVPAPPAPDPARAERDRAFAPLPATAATPALDGREGLTEKGHHRIRWSGPDPIPLNEMFGIDLVVARADASPLSAGATVEVDAGMPGHGHGMTLKPRTTCAADGACETRGMLFHMPGDWEISVRVTEGDVVDSARFRVNLP